MLFCGFWLRWFKKLSYYYGDKPVPECSYFTFIGQLRRECWRFVTYILVHLGHNHLLHWRQISIKTETNVLHLEGALMKHILEGMAPLRHLLNEETLFMSWRRYGTKEVNDWNLRSLAYDFQHVDANNCWNSSGNVSWNH